MKLFLKFFLIVIIFLSINVHAKAIVKVLHLSLHKGCINDFEQAAKELSLDVTSWFILSSEESRKLFDDQAKGNAIYNIGHERAHRIWQKHKDYFNSFDVIITSDTAPLSRLFLQNGWQKPLIIWICNCFDYYDAESLDCDFPDQEYYDLFAKAMHQKNIKIISYTPYEYFYALKKGIDIGTFTIKPLGSVCIMAHDSIIPENVIKAETLFIPPRLGDLQKLYLLQKCEDITVKAYCGNYNGPCDLKDFKAILHFPYQWSNLALFENIQNGLIHFVPSIKFVKQLINENKPIAYLTYENFEWAEWYRQENKDLFVYFDSWQDLKEKTETTDFQAKKELIMSFARRHKEIMLERWKSVFKNYGDRAL